MPVRPFLALACGLLAAPAALLAAAVPARDDLSQIQRARLQVLLKGTAEAIRSDYYDPTFHGIDLNAAEAKARERIAGAHAIGEVFGAIADFALTLDDSHTLFYPPMQNVAVHYGWTMGIVGDDCYVDLVVKGSDAERQGVHRGDRVLAVNGFQPTRATLFKLQYLFRALRPQPGLHVELQTPAGERRELDLASRFEKRRELYDLTDAGNGDVQSLEIMEEQQDVRLRPSAVPIGDDVMLLRLPAFAIAPADMRFAMRAARSRTALIIDLRGNPGGYGVSLAELYGQLSEQDTTLASNQERKRRVALLSKGSGNAAYKGRLFVLIDAGSKSASEIFARTVQLQNRGTVIGDRSGGAVMAARAQAILASEGENLMAATALVTIADVVMPDGGRLEKTGVTPDFVVLPTAADLATGRDPALARTLKFLGHDVDPAAAWALVHDSKDEQKHVDD
jgi:carboxyl-terminal processing protease